MAYHMPYMGGTISRRISKEPKRIESKNKSDNIKSAGDTKAWVLNI